MWVSVGMVRVNGQATKLSVTLFWIPSTNMSLILVFPMIGNFLIHQSLVALFRTFPVHQSLVQASLGVITTQSLSSG